VAGVIVFLARDVERGIDIGVLSKVNEEDVLAEQ